MNKKYKYLNILIVIFIVFNLSMNITSFANDEVIPGAIFNKAKELANGRDFLISKNSDSTYTIAYKLGSGDFYYWSTTKHLGVGKSMMTKVGVVHSKDSYGNSFTDPLISTATNKQEISPNIIYSTSDVYDFSDKDKIFFEKKTPDMWEKMEMATQIFLAVMLPIVAPVVSLMVCSIALYHGLRFLKTSLIGL